MKRVVRIDDVNSNTDRKDFDHQIDILYDKFDEIILGVNLISKTASNGAVYPELPLRGHPPKYFYDVDKVLSLDYIKLLRSLPKISIVSHGLVHCMHSQMTKDAIEMSILTSCALLDTKRFIPPFNEVNADVVDVCNNNGIEIIGNNEHRTWKSIEVEKYDKDHPYWYYHPWRVSSDNLYMVLL